MEVVAELPWYWNSAISFSLGAASSGFVLLRLSRWRNESQQRHRDGGTSHNYTINVSGDLNVRPDRKRSRASDLDDVIDLATRHMPGSDEDDAS